MDDDKGPGAIDEPTAALRLQRWWHSHYHVALFDEHAQVCAARWMFYGTMRQEWCTPYNLICAGVPLWLVAFFEAHWVPRRDPALRERIKNGVYKLVGSNLWTRRAGIQALTNFCVRGRCDDEEGTWASDEEKLAAFDATMRLTMSVADTQPLVPIPERGEDPGVEAANQTAIQKLLKDATECARKTWDAYANGLPPDQARRAHIMVHSHHWKVCSAYAVVDAARSGYLHGMLAAAHGDHDALLDVLDGSAMAGVVVDRLRFHQYLRACGPPKKTDATEAAGDRKTKWYEDALGDEISYWYTNLIHAALQLEQLGLPDGNLYKQATSRALAILHDPGLLAIRRSDLVRIYHTTLKYLQLRRVTAMC